MKIFKSKRRRNELLTILLVIAGLSFFSYTYIDSHIGYFLQPQNLRTVVQGFGIYGPLAIALMQFLQVVIIPVPPVVPVVSGYIFGPFHGTFYSLIGAFLGSFITIYLSRIYGRRFVSFFVNEEFLAKFDAFTTSKGLLPYIVLFTIPGFHDDALCLIAGLTKIDARKLVLIATFGRIPGIFALALTGSSIATSQYFLVLIISTGFIVVSILSVEFEEEIIEIAHRLEVEGLSAVKEHI